MIHRMLSVVVPVLFVSFCTILGISPTKEFVSNVQSISACHKSKTNTTDNKNCSKDDGTSTSALASTSTSTSALATASASASVSASASASASTLASVFTSASESASAFSSTSTSTSTSKSHQKLPSQSNPSTQTPKLHKLPSALNLTIHENLLTSDECNAVTTFAIPFLRPSKVGRPAKIQPSLRLAYSCKIPRLPHPLLWSVEHKLAQAAGVPVERGEDLQVGGYPIGHYYGMHCDERKGGRPGGGGRLATALAYLNDLDGTKVRGGYTVFSGARMHLPGGVDFPRSDVRVRELKRLSGEGVSGNGSGESENEIATRVKPKQGRVITFRNLVATTLNNGDTANGAYRFVEESTHGASPVYSLTDPPPPEGTEGTVKYVVQQWFGLESEVNISRHPGLISHLGLGVADSYDGVDPMMDLASPDGEPRGVVAGKGSYGAVVEKVPSLIPGIGASRIRGWCASIESKGLPIPANADVTNRPIAAGIWFMLNTDSSNGTRASVSGSSHLMFDSNGATGVDKNDDNTIASGDQQIFRVGPHVISVSKKGEIIWSVGSRSTRSAASQILPKRWYHLALAVESPHYAAKQDSGADSSNNTVLLRAEIGISIPGQAPRPPLTMEIACLDAVPEWIEGISVGGFPKGVETGGGTNVDLTVTDFYAVRDDMKGKGHSFAFAIVYYDPAQGT